MKTRQDAGDVFVRDLGFQISEYIVLSGRISQHLSERNHEKLVRTASVLTGI
jgi:hypothetical protein